MSKRRHGRSTKPVNGLTPVTQVPAAPRFTAPSCSSCRSDNTGVYTTKRDSEFIIRYCKCQRCGWTWTDVTRNLP